MTEDTIQFEIKILQEAIKALSNRGADHGPFKETYAQTAELWMAHLKRRGVVVKISAKDVLIMMAYMKLARASCGNPKQMDHYIDPCGYIALAGAVDIT